MGSFNLPHDNALARNGDASINHAFVACTRQGVCGIVGGGEQRVGSPITSSNHPLAWLGLRLAGIREEIDGLGRLLRTHLPG